MCSPLLATSIWRDCRKKVDCSKVGLSQLIIVWFFSAHRLSNHQFGQRRHSSRLSHSVGALLGHCRREVVGDSRLLRVHSAGVSLDRSCGTVANRWEERSHCGLGLGWVRDADGGTETRRSAYCVRSEVFALTRWLRKDNQWPDVLCGLEEWIGGSLCRRLGLRTDVESGRKVVFTRPGLGVAEGLHDGILWSARVCCIYGRCKFCQLDNDVALR